MVRAESSLREVLAARRGEERQVGAGPTVLRAKIIHQHLTIYSVISPGKEKHF